MFKQNKKNFMLLALTLVFALFLAACGKEVEKEEVKSEDKPKEEEVNYTVDHAMGSTTITKEPKKVVILTNEGTEALLALGVKPVGAVKSWIGDPWYAHIANDMEGVEVVGTESEVTLEAIAALQPDLIIGNKMRQEKLYDQLNEIAPTIFAETLRGNWKENFELYAKALNKEEEGQQIIADYDNRISTMKEELGDKLTQKVSIVRFMAGDVRIYHKDSFSGVILDQLGFARAEGQDAPDFAEKNVTKERIPAMDGDILFYFTYEEGDGKASAIEKEWLEDPLFKNLSVAKAGNVHKVEDVIWNTAGGVIAANKMLDDIETYFLK
ncbi:ABC transporter substrate-binding protein [Peribacillus acanthi]|uniref:ABC transporter substrate-binding protein n=1 Tax=Peribacillus acanthi TaxID=2171554 RepID=UPI000D3E62EB|nr:iron-siderophore ABC transporter substrate-binding protein [Peribacillus acanthi]